MQVSSGYGGAPRGRGEARRSRRRARPRGCAGRPATTRPPAPGALPARRRRGARRNRDQQHYNVRGRLAAAGGHATASQVLAADLVPQLAHRAYLARHARGALAAGAHALRRGGLHRLPRAQRALQHL
jgi:hypothetical protein